jgi:hypothetical protein
MRLFNGDDDLDDAGNQQVTLSPPVVRPPGPTMDAVAGKLELQQALLNAKLVYRPPGIAKASDSMPVSVIRSKW